MRIWPDHKLAYALNSAMPEGVTSLRKIADAIGASGYDPYGRAYYQADKLRGFGLLSKGGYGRWEITEKGRIVLALLEFQAERRRKRKLRGLYNELTNAA